MTPEDDEPDLLIEAATERRQDRGWPIDDTPLVRSVGLSATVREPGDEIVAVLCLFDTLGDRRYVQLTQESALQLMKELAVFLWQIR